MKSEICYTPQQQNDPYMTMMMMNPSLMVDPNLILDYRASAHKTGTIHNGGGDDHHDHNYCAAIYRAKNSPNTFFEYHRAAVDETNQYLDPHLDDNDPLLQFTSYNDSQLEDIILSVDVGDDDDDDDDDVNGLYGQQQLDRELDELEDIFRDIGLPDLPEIFSPGTQEQAEALLESWDQFKAEFDDNDQDEQKFGDQQVSPTVVPPHCFDGFDPIAPHNVGHYEEVYSSPLRIEEVEEPNGENFEEQLEGGAQLNPIPAICYMDSEVSQDGVQDSISSEISPRPRRNAPKRKFSICSSDCSATLIEADNEMEMEMETLPPPQQQKRRKTSVKRRARRVQDERVKNQNKVAALKYRKRKREEMGTLDEQLGDEEERNSALRSQIDELTVEINVMKELLGKYLPK